MHCKVEECGDVRFAKNVCAEKNAESFQFVNNNLPTYNLPNFGKSHKKLMICQKDLSETKLL